MTDPVTQALMARVAEPVLDQIAADPRFNTRLSPEQEALFRVWKQHYAPKDSGYDYDLRGAFLAGLTPDPKTKHWDDRFKKPNEPTFSTFSDYASAMPQLAGTWRGDQYAPPTFPVPVARPQR